MIDNFSSYHTVTTLSGAHQTIVGGPVASQEVIKDAGNNGGGFFNANSSHPFESPNPFTNWFEIFLLLLTAFALPRTFGKMVKDNRQGYALLAVMVIIWLAAVGGISFFEAQGAGVAPQLAHGAMEGKNVAFGTPGSLAVRGLDHGHLDRLGELASMTRSPRSAAASRCSTSRSARSRPAASAPACTASWCWPSSRCSSAGLMVGRTPEYIGKKIRPTEMKYAALYFLTLPVLILTAAGLSIGTEDGPGIDLQPRPARADRDHVRVHLDGQQQRLGVRRPDARHATWYNIARRHRDAARPVRAGDLRPRPGRVAGQTGSRCRRAPGTLDTRTPLFVGMLVGVILILVGLTYFPALALGPFAEGLH